MKIGIVGCGALGSYYGSHLCREGHETWFLLRSDWDQVVRMGVQVRGADPLENFKVHPFAARTPGEIGVCDLVIVGLKTTANHRLRDWVAPLAGPGTAVLTLQNGLGNEEALAAFLPGEQILGGLCFVSLNRISPGVVLHINGGRILMGEFKGAPGPRTHRLAEVFRRAGIPTDLAADLALAHWLKLVWNIAFNGLGVAAAAGFDAVESGRVDPARPLGPCLSTDQLLADPRWRERVREVMLEVVLGAGALGLEIEPDYADAEIGRTEGMGSYRASTLVDFERGSPMELESVFLDPLRKATAAGARLPRIESLCRVLQALEEQRQPAGSK
jgi:2-dehydropantoate 2-reductase